MTLRLKLIMAFGIVLVLAGVQAAFTVVLLGRVSERSAQTVAPALGRVDLLAHLQSDLLRLRIVEYSLIAADEPERQQLTGEILQLQRQIGQEIENYAAADLDPDRAASLADVRQAYQQYLNSVGSEQAAVGRGEATEAGREYLSFQSSFAALDGQLHTLRHLEYRATEAMRDDMIDVAAWSRWPLGLMVVAITGAELALGWHVSHRIDRSLGALRRGAERIAGQKFDERVVAPPERELAELADTLNHVMEALAAHKREAARAERERALIARERLSQIVRAQERERARISRELHDQAGQALTALNYGLTRVHGLLRDTPAAREIERLMTIGADTTRQIAGLARDLRPSVLDDLGLLPALRSCARGFSDHIGIPVSFKVQGVVPRLPQEVETAIFRVVQEALTNVAKHARASQASVEIGAREGRLEVRVSDNGAGFDAEALMRLVEEGSAPEQTLGLAGIRERVQLLDGEFRVSSEQGNGARLMVSIPLPAPAERAFGSDGAAGQPPREAVVSA